LGAVLLSPVHRLEQLVYFGKIGHAVEFTGVTVGDVARWMLIYLFCSVN
jgi:hypothetical protein